MKFFDQSNRLILIDTWRPNNARDYGTVKLFTAMGIKRRTLYQIIAKLETGRSLDSKVGSGRIARKMNQENVKFHGPLTLL